MVRIICLLILVLEAIGLSISIRERGWKIFAFYTQLSNIITAGSALLVILFGETDWTVYQRYISSCMLLMTFIVTTASVFRQRPVSPSSGPDPVHCFLSSDRTACEVSFGDRSPDGDHIHLRCRHALAELPRSL